MPSRSTRRSPSALVALVLLLLMPLAPNPAARAGEEDEAQSDLRMALIETGVLSCGVPGWIRARGPSLRPMDSDEAAPLFGYEEEEARYPMGQINDLIDLLKTAVAPSAWESIDGADIIEASSDRMVVRAPRELILKVQRYLEQQEARILRPVTIELQARIAAGPEAAAAIARHRGNLSNEAWSEILGQTTLVRAATVTALEGQDATARSGSQRAWLASCEGVNRDTPLSADPEIRVANLGMCAGVRAQRVGNGRTLLSLNCVLAQWAGVEEMELEADLSVQTPRFARTSADGEYLLRNGSWHVIQAPGADSGTLLLARVQDGLEAMPEDGDRPRFAGPLFLPRMARSNQPGMPLNQYDCAGLDFKRNSAHAPERRLHLTNYESPEPSELDEPRPLFPPENLPELIMMLGDEDDWDDPATIEVRGGQLCVRTTPAIHRQIGELVESMQTRLVPAIALDVQVVEGSLDLLGTLGLETLGRGTLGAQQMAALRSALTDGSARHLGRQRLRSRNSLASESTGTESHYLADYDVRRQKSGATSATAVMGEVFTGLQVEARALPSLDGRSVRVDLDVWRSQASDKQVRTIQTPHGALTLPAMDVMRLQGTAKVLLGRTQVVGGAVDHGRVQLVLVSARWE